MEDLVEENGIRDVKSELMNSIGTANMLEKSGSMSSLKHFKELKNDATITGKNCEMKLDKIMINEESKLATDVKHCNKEIISMVSDADLGACISESKINSPIFKPSHVTTADNKSVSKCDASEPVPKTSQVKSHLNEIQVIKATSVSQKLSNNVLEECGRTVGDVSIAVDGFGLITTDQNTEVVKRYTFTNKSKMQVQIITLGATVTSIKLPDKNGVLEDIALGFDSIEDYFEHSNPNIGCTLGRDAFETLQDEHYSGLGLFNWVATLDDSKLVLSHISHDGWHGYRGTVLIRAIFELKKDNSLHVSYWATSTTTTSINLSLNLFLNLAGHAAKHTELYNHIITINGDKSIKERTYRLSKFKPQYVGGTVYDLRTPHEIGPVIARSPQYGFDKYYILTKGTEQTISFAARVLHPESGRYLEIYTDQGGIQFYTADYFPEGASADIIPTEIEESDGKDSTTEFESSSENKSNQSLKSLLRSKGCEIKGKNGASYQRHGSFCINSLSLPAEESIGKNFQNNVLIPGHSYEHRIIYKFGVVDH